MKSFSRRIILGMAAIMALSCDGDGPQAPPPARPQFPRIEVIVATEGVDIYHLGYQAVITEGGRSTGQTVHRNDRVGFRGWTEGEYSVRLTKVPSNCVVADGDTRIVHAVFGQTAQVSFEVICQRFDGIAVTASVGPGTGFVGFGTVTLVDADGGTWLTLAQGGAPSWSPEGNRVVFVSARWCYWDWYYYGWCGPDPVDLSPPVPQGLWRFDMGGPGRPLTVSDLDGHPVWHPGGEVIVFVRGTLIYRIRPDGSGEELFADLPIQSAAHLAWSPDGSQLAFTCRLDEADPDSSDLVSDICVVQEDGTGFRRITDALGYEAHPAWHPDGSQIAFTTNRFGTLGIAVMTVGGSGTTLVVEGTQPTWSPDGERLAFVREGDGLFVINADGTDERRLKSGSYDAPAWRP